ncbi:hypothetical protein BH10PSE11_BH10PSE11_08010 [soil metagenome]
MRWRFVAPLRVAMPIYAITTSRRRPTGHCCLAMPISSSAGRRVWNLLGKFAKGGGVCFPIALGH